jgi:hypothetical protein
MYIQKTNEADIETSQHARMVAAFLSLARTTYSVWKVHFRTLMCIT